MKVITKLDYEILKRIPLYPEEKTRGEIVQEIKSAFPDGTYNKLATGIFDAVLLKYTKIFPIIENKAIPDTIFFEDLYNDADCLQSTLEPLPLEWVKENIGAKLDVGEDDVYKELLGLIQVKPRTGWYRQSDFSLRGME